MNPGKIVLLSAIVAASVCAVVTLEGCGKENVATPALAPQFPPPKQQTEPVDANALFQDKETASRIRAFLNEWAK